MARPNRCTDCKQSEPAVMFYPRSKVTRCVGCQRVYMQGRYAATHGVTAHSHKRKPAPDAVCELDAITATWGRT